MSKELLFSVTSKDCEWQFFRGSGKGGQHRNKRDTAARCVHRPSGAVGESQEHKSREQNRRAAFRRMAESKEFKTWWRKEVARLTGEEVELQNRVNRAMAPSNLRVEIKSNDRWVPEGSDEPSERGE